MAVALLLCTFFTASSVSVAVDTFYVARDGKDTWSGRLPLPNSQQTDGPFATIFRARDAVRLSSNSVPNDVLIAPGYYELNETFLLTDKDCRDTRTTYKALNMSSIPVLSGGETVRGWKVGRDGLWTTHIPGDFTVTQLFVNGQRRPVAKIPNSGYLYWSSPIKPCHATPGNQQAASHKLKAIFHTKANINCPPIDSWGFVYNNSDIMANWTNMHDIELLVFHAWTATWHNIKSVFTENHTVFFEQPSTYPPGWNVPPSGQRYVVTNVKEGLDSPGEWYFDSIRRTLSYYPEKGESPVEATVIVPKLTMVVSLQNTTNLRFEGLSVQFAAARNRQSYRAASHAFEITDSNNIVLEGCEVLHTEANGFVVNGESQHISINNCRAADVGGDGISTTIKTRHILINNSIVDCTGFIFLQQPAGIRIGGQENITVQFNEVMNVPYGGILVGWQPGFHPSEKDPIFRIQYNHIHNHGMKILNDFGGVYVSAGVQCWQPPVSESCYMSTLVHQNIIHNGQCFNYGADGIYTDEAAGGVTITSNLVYKVDAVGIYFHCGTQNSASNNFLISTDRLGKRGALSGCNMGGFTIQVPQNFSFSKNIVLLTSGNLIGSNEYVNTTFDFNLYYNTSVPLIFPNHTTFQQWQASGQDLNSTVSDPKFRSVSKCDFVLQPESPAIKLGIKQIDYSSVGPHDNPFGPWKTE